MGIRQPILKWRPGCNTVLLRALDKRGYLMIIKDNFSYFLLKPYVVTLLLNRLDETVQIMGHNIGFYAELTKIIPNYHQIHLSRAQLLFTDPSKM